MRRALAEVDLNTPNANRRPQRACAARVAATTPPNVVVGRDAPATDGSAQRAQNKEALARAATLYRETNVDSPCRNDDGHLSMQEALDLEGYVGNNGKSILARKLNIARDKEVQRETRIQEEGAIDSLLIMSQGLGYPEDENWDDDADEREAEPAPSQPGRKGNSGRPRMSQQEREIAERSRHGVNGYDSFADYARAFMEAVEIVRQTPNGSKLAKARELVAEKFTRLGEPSVTAAHLTDCARDENFDEVRRRGGPLLATREEIEIANKVRSARAHYLAVSVYQVMQHANAILKRDDARWQKTHCEGVTRGWFDGFARRNGLNITTKKDLDVMRARWSTSKNANLFYDNLYVSAVELGCATVNEDHDLTIPGSSLLTFTNPGLLVSMDETAVSLSREASHSNAERIVSAGPTDRGECLHSKSLPPATLVYSRNGLNQLLPPMVVIGGREKLPESFEHINLVSGERQVTEETEVDEEEFPVPPNIYDDDERLLPTVWVANKKGSMTGEFMMEWAMRCLLPSMQSYGLSAERPGILLYDGVQVHLNFEFLTSMKEHNVHVFLRVPNMSNLIQGEDTVVFPSLKSHQAQAMAELINERNATSERGAARGLEWDDLTEVLKRMFSKMDTYTLNKQAWAAEGIIPFDRRVAVQLAVEELDVQELEIRKNMMSTYVPRSPIQAATPQAQVKHKYILPKVNDRNQKTLKTAIGNLFEIESLRERFSELVECEDPDEGQALNMLSEVLEKFENIKLKVEGWCSGEARVPRASDLWDVPGGITSDAALALMRTAAANTQQPAQRPAGPRGPHGGNLEAEMANGDHILSDLLAQVPNQPNWRDLDRQSLLALYTRLFERWYPCQASIKFLKQELQRVIPVELEGVYEQEENVLQDETMSPSYNISEGDVTWGEFEDDSSPRVADMSIVNHAEHDESM